jgi:hypothetical protein
MRSIPIDNSRVGVIKFLQVSPVSEFNSTEHKKNADGVPVYEVQCLVTTEGFSGGEDNDLLKVKIAAHNPPRVAPMTEIAFGNFVARAWTTANGKSGVSFSADSVNAAAAPVSDNK